MVEERESATTQKCPVRTYGPYLRALLVRHGVFERDVDDVLQEVWEIFARYAHGLSGDLRVWLVRVALNRAGNYYQQRRKDHQQLVDVRAEESPDPDPELDAEQWIIGKHVARVVDDLDADLRAVVMATMAGETIEEMSERLSVPKGTCNSRLRRARTRIKAAVG